MSVPTFILRATDSELAVPASAAAFGSWTRTTSLRTGRSNGGARRPSSRPFRSRRKQRQRQLEYDAAAAELASASQKYEIAQPAVYASRELVPSAMLMDLNRARVVVARYHALCAVSGCRWPRAHGVSRSAATTPLRPGATPTAVASVWCRSAAKCSRATRTP